MQDRRGPRRRSGLTPRIQTSADHSVAPWAGLLCDPCRPSCSREGHQRLVEFGDMIAEGDQVVTKKTFHGTHTAELAGIPPTGRTVTLQYVDIRRVRDGRITEHWLAMDQLSFMQQLGVIPDDSAKEE
ncbi:MAG: ester cyclase [Aeromicrobium sp.]